jgi:hypothetical protein
MYYSSFFKFLKILSVAYLEMIAFAAFEVKLSARGVCTLIFLKNFGRVEPEPGLVMIRRTVSRHRVRPLLPLLPHPLLMHQLPGRPDQVAMWAVRVVSCHFFFF